MIDTYVPYMSSRKLKSNHQSNEHNKYANEKAKSLTKLNHLAPISRNKRSKRDQNLQPDGLVTHQNKTQANW